MPTSRPLHLPPSSSSGIDFLALANHVFVLCSVGYVVGNFFRSIVGDSIDAQLSDAFANSLFFCLALLFVVDAFLYTACMFDGLLPRKKKAAEQVMEAGEEGGLQDVEGGNGEHGRGRSSSADVHQHHRHQRRQRRAVADPRRHRRRLLRSYSLHTSDSTSSSSTQHPTTSHSTSSHSIPSPSSSSTTILSDPSYRSLFPLTVDGWGEVLNIVASFIALISSILPFLSVLSFDNSGAGDRFVRWQIMADNSSMLLWLVDSLVYFRAWKVSLPMHAGQGVGKGGRRGCWQPRHPYMWANVFNVLASLVYVASAVYAAVGVRVLEWLLGNGGVVGSHYDTRQVQREQRDAGACGRCDVPHLRHHHGGRLVPGQARGERGGRAEEAREAAPPPARGAADRTRYPDALDLHVPVAAPSGARQGVRSRRGCADAAL